MIPHPNVPREARPLYVALTRLLFHSEKGSGRVVDGLKVDLAFEVGVQDNDDLPYVQLADVSHNDARFAGATNRGAGPVLINTQQVTFTVVANRSFGIIRTDYNDPRQGPGIMDWVARIKTAIETDEEGEPDAFLSDTLTEPIVFSASNVEVDQVSSALELVCTIVTPAFYPGSRADISV